MTTTTCVTLIFATLISSFWVITGAPPLQDSPANNPTPPQPHYYGCFDGTDPFPEFGISMLDTLNNNIKCQKFCLDEGYMFSVTHGEFCGCLKKHPLKEFSGPIHRGATFKVHNVQGRKCSTKCPGDPNGGQCQAMEKNCCGGPAAYTVSIVGGLKHCKNSDLRGLEKWGVNLQGSNLPTLCLPVDSARKRDQTSSKANRHADRYTKKMLRRKPYTRKNEKRSKLYENPYPAEVAKAFQRSKRYGEGCGAKDAEITRKKGQDFGFNACCSPCCDWLLDYLEIDGTVVKCVD